MCGVIVDHLKTDPSAFREKLSERLRIDGLFHQASGIDWRISQAERSDLRKLADRGELVAVLEKVLRKDTRSSWRDLKFARKCAEDLTLLQREVPVGKKIEDAKVGSTTKVLHLLNNSLPYTTSGYTVRTQQMIKSQQEAGINALGMTRFAYPAVIGRIATSPRIKVDRVTYLANLGWLFPSSKMKRHNLAVDEVVRQARRYSVDLIHATTDYQNALVAADAAQILGIPWVYEIRGQLESTWLANQPDPLRETARASDHYVLARSQETACMKAASAVVVLSEISREDCIRRGVIPQKIHVIPNAVDEELIGYQFDRNGIRRSLGLDPDVTLVGTVTSVVAYEGLDVLIRALELLPTTFSILIVGDGVERPNLEALALRLGLSDRVIFAGKQPSNDIWKWYAALDVFVVPRIDTKVTRVVTPLKPLAALALGIPVVASDLPALREVTGGKAAYFPSGSIEHLATELQKATEYTDPTSRDFVLTRTWTQNAQRYLELYSGKPAGSERKNNLD